MSIIELQQYQLLNVDDILLNVDDSRWTVDYINANKKSHPSIVWLDKCILYCPMYVMNKPNGSQRNKCLTIFIICIILIANIVLQIPFIYSLSSININNAMNILCHTIKLCSRFCGLYYFYTKFDYQYRYYTPAKFNESSNKKNGHKTLLTLILIIFVFIEIAWIYGVCFDSNYYNLDQNMSLNLLKWAYCIVNAICFDAPSILTLVIHYRLTMKYQQYLRQIIDELNKDIIELEAIFDRYKSLYQTFKTEYVFTLKLTLQFYIFYVTSALWINTYNITYWKGNDYSIVLWRTAENIWCILAVIMYVIPSSYVCKQYYQLDNELWNYSEHFFRDKSQDQISCNYLLHFIKKFPVIIRIGNIITVTIYNFVLLIFAFVVAKSVAYLINFN